jgi:hypothetical protein
MRAIHPALRRMDASAGKVTCFSVFVPSCFRAERSALVSRLSIINTV